MFARTSCFARFFLSLSMLTLIVCQVEAAPVITSFNPTRGSYNTQITIKGTGLQCVIMVLFNGHKAQFSKRGSDKIIAYVPDDASTGLIEVSAWGANCGGNTTSAEPFTVTPGAVLTPAIGPPTSKVTVTGLGFQPFAAVDIFIDTTDTALVLTNETGNFSIPVKIPSQALPGTHWISAVQRFTGQGAQSTFTVQTDWTQFNSQNGANRFNPYENVLTSANVANLEAGWSAFTSNGDALSSPVVAGGMVYVGAADGKLYAFDAECATDGDTCVPSWLGETQGGIFGSPAVGSGRVYVASEDGYLYAFPVSCGLGDRQWVNCKPVWKGEIGQYTGSSPAFAGGLVYVGSPNGKLYAFKSNCGNNGAVCSPEWSANPGSAIWTSPAVFGGLVYVSVSNDGGAKLHAYKVGCATGGNTCSSEWSASLGVSTGVYSSPVVAGGLVFVGSSDKLYVFRAKCGAGGATCSPLWIGHVGGSIHTTPAVANGVVYLAANDPTAQLFAFKANGCGTVPGGECNASWTMTLGDTLQESSPAIAGELIFVGGSDRMLHVLKACTRSVDGCYELSSLTTYGNLRSSPAISDGAVYVTSGDGNLYKFIATGLDHPSPDSANSSKVRANQSAKSQPPQLHDLKPDWALKPTPTQMNRRWSTYSY